MSNVLTQAFHQWANRPADERFTSLDQLHNHCSDVKNISRETPNVTLRELGVIAGRPDLNSSDTEPFLIGPTGTTARFTHHSFGQFCRVVGAPASYMRELPAELVAENMNHSLRTSDRVMTEDGARSGKLLFSKNGDLKLRAVTGDGYTRIWNSDITSRLLRFVQQYTDWQPAPAAFDGSRGLYAGDKDVFAFLVNNNRPIFDSLPGGGLGRGFFVSNSEVGDASFRLTTFMYEYICGNHRVWGAKGVYDLRIPHVGNADDRAFRSLGVELRKYTDAATGEDVRKIEACRKFKLGSTKDEVLDAAFGLRVISRAKLEQAYDLAVAHSDWYGDPRSAWGLTGGLTEIARDLPNADERVVMDRAAGKIMQMAF